MTQGRKDLFWLTVSEVSVLIQLAAVSKPWKAEQYCGGLNMLTSWPPGIRERDTGSDWEDSAKRTYTQ